MRVYALRASPPMPGVHDEKTIDASLVELERSRERYKSDHRRVGTIKLPAVSAVVGKRGSGKTLYIVSKLARAYARGWKVYSTQPAGLFFGDLITPDELYDFVETHRDCVIFIDELQSYLNKLSTTSTTTSIFYQSMAGIRKNNIKVIVGTQTDRHFGEFMRYTIEMVEYPRVDQWHYKTTLGTWGNRNTKRVLRGPRALPSWTKLKVRKAWGESVLAYNDPPSSEEIIFQTGRARPRRRNIVLSPVEMWRASKLYDSWSPIEVGAQLSMNSHDFRRRAKKRLDEQREESA